MPIASGHPLDSYRRQPSEAAFAALYDRAAPLVWTICRRVVRDEEDARDAFQSAFCRLAALDRLNEEFPAGADPDRIIKTVAVREADALRKRRARRQKNEIAVEELPVAADDSPPADRVAQERQVREMIDAALAALPDGDRVPVALYFFQGMTHQEIGASLGMPARTVSGRIARALKKLEPRMRRQGLAEAFLSLGGAAGTSLAAPPTEVSAATIYAKAQGIAAAKVAASWKGLLPSKGAAFAAGCAVTIAIILGAAWRREAPSSSIRAQRALAASSLNQAGPVSDAVVFFDGVIAGQPGIGSRADIGALPEFLASMDIAAPQESLAETFLAPVDAASLRIKFHVDRAGFLFHLGMFDVETVAGLEPGSAEYCVAAIKRALMLLDDMRADPGAEIEIAVPATGLAGKRVGFFIVPNDRAENFLRRPAAYTPKGNGNEILRSPLFTISAANPGGLDQALAFEAENQTIIAFEDMSRLPPRGAWPNSNETFDDLVFSIAPALVPGAARP